MSKDEEEHLLMERSHLRCTFRSILWMSIGHREWKGDRNT